MRRLVVALALLLLPVSLSAQDYARFDSVKAVELEPLDSVPEAWEEQYERVDECLEGRAWNRIPLDSVDIYTYRVMRTPATTTSGDRKMVAVKGLLWFEKGEPPEMYLNKYYAASVIAHETIHLLAPHLRHKHDIFDECS